MEANQNNLKQQDEIIGNKYIIEKYLYYGGFSIVYKVKDITNDKINTL